MIDITDDVKERIEYQVKSGRISLTGIPFTVSQKAYYMTNENMTGYMDSLEGTKKLALSVTGSGDHILNLLSKNVLDIETFDTNAFAAYYALGLKKALILKCSYQEYLDVMQKLGTSKDLEYQTQVLFDVLPYMEKEYRDFWSSILEYNYKIQKDNKTILNIIDLLFLNIKSTDVFVKNNPYLKDEASYEATKENLKKARVVFTNTDALFLDKVYSKHEFDIIMISNILDYFNRSLGNSWNKKDLDKYIDSLRGILSDEGIIYLHYIFKYGKSFQKTHIIQCSSVTKNDIDGEIISFPSNICPIYDGMVTVRK